jgi:hypothetical protein
MLEKDRNELRLSCKNTAKQSVDALNLAITHLKTLAKAQEKSKKECLKATDLKIKESNMILQKNLKGCKKLTTTIDSLHKNIGVQASTISNLNWDIMSKIRECDMLKKENKTLSSEVTTLGRKCLDVDERKMQHALELKRISVQVESVKMRKYEQTEVMKEQMNTCDHERKIKTIEFTASTHQCVARQRNKKGRRMPS